MAEKKLVIRDPETERQIRRFLEGRVRECSSKGRPVVGIYEDEKVKRHLGVQTVRRCTPDDTTYVHCNNCHTIYARRHNPKEARAYRTSLDISLDD